MNAIRSAGLAPLLATGNALAQNRPMMNGSMWGSGWMGGYGGYLLPILVVAVAVGLVVWVVNQRKK